nr:MAG TPA: hypothetical protein [Caudoviricetes sp.]
MCRITSYKAFLWLLVVCMVVYTSNGLKCLKTAKNRLSACAVFSCNASKKNTALAFA